MLVWIAWGRVWGEWGNWLEISTHGDRYDADQAAQKWLDAHAASPEGTWPAETVVLRKADGVPIATNKKGK